MRLEIGRALSWLTGACWRSTLATRAPNAGLEALPLEKRQRAQLAEAEALLNNGDYVGAQQKVLRVLADDANNRDAQKLARRIEEKNNRDAIAGSNLNRALQKPVTLEFRDSSMQTVFELLSKTRGPEFHF